MADCWPTAAAATTRDLRRLDEGNWLSGYGDSGGGGGWQKFNAGLFLQLGKRRINAIVDGDC